MANFINNTHIGCPDCGYGTFRGRESSIKNKDGSIQEECRWICPRCNRLARLDERTIPAPKKED